MDKTTEVAVVERGQKDVSGPEGHRGGMGSPLAMVAPFWERPFNVWPLTERMRLCEFLAQSNSIPKSDQGNPANVYFKAERGARLGLSPTEALSHILVVNGATSVWGDMGLALVRKSGLLETHDEWFEVDGVRQADDDIDVVALHNERKRVVAKVLMKRKGEPAKTVSYSVQDAIDAGLWGVKDTWKKSPKRMLMWRPRSFVMRDKFQDVLMGFVTVEEALDLAPQEVSGIAAASQTETKGAALVETLGGAQTAEISRELTEEIEMLESMLNGIGLGEQAAKIWRELKIGSRAEMTAEQAMLYVRAMGLAVDAHNQADDERRAASGKLL
jgi:hypothetical protein